MHKEHVSIAIDGVINAPLDGVYTLYSKISTIAIGV